MSKAPQAKVLPFHSKAKATPRPSMVPCVRCKKDIPFSSTRCPECGVFFQGYAEDFASKPRDRRWLLWVGALLLLIFVLNLVRV